MDDYISKPKNGDDLVVELFTKLERGIKRRDKEMTRWKYNEKFEDLYQWGGEHLEKGADDEFTINKIAAYIRNYRAEVAYNEPRVKLTPKTPGGWRAVPVPAMDGSVRMIVPAKAREALINGILSAPNQNLQQTSGLLTKAGVVAWGCIKSSYEPMYSTPPKTDKKQYIPLKDGKLDLSGFERNPVDGSLVEGEDSPLVERNDIPAWEDFTIKWVSYKDMIIDPDGGPYWKDHSWVCEEEIRSLESVKEDPLFENKKGIKASGLRGPGVPEDRSEPYSKWSEPGEVGEREEYVRLFHFYDIDRQRYYVLADGHDKALRDLSWQELGITDHPYEDFRPSLGTDGTFYQRPVVSDLIPLAQMYNVLSQMEVRGAQNSTRKIFTKRGALKQEALEALTNTQDLAVVEVEVRTGESLASLVQPYIPPNTSLSILQAKANLARDFDEIGGISGEAAGVSRSDTATQAQILESYNTGRIGHDRKILSECWERAFENFNDLIDENMTQARAVQIQGDDGQLFTAMIDKDMIAGDYAVDVDFQELAPPNTAMMNSAKVQMMQIAGQNPWMFADEALAREFFEPIGIKSENFIRAIVRMAQAQMQMLQQAQQKVPEAGAPNSEAQALAQNAAGSQVPRLQGAT